MKYFQTIYINLLYPQLLFFIYWNPTTFVFIFLSISNKLITLSGGGPKLSNFNGHLSLHETSCFRVSGQRSWIYISMEKDNNYSGNFPSIDYSIDHQQQQQHGDNGTQVVDYMLTNPPQQHISSGFNRSTSFDKLSFADVMQFADFGPKLALNQTKSAEEDTGIDPVYFLKFPVLNDKLQAGESLKVVGDGEREDETRISESTSVQLQFLGEDETRVPEGKNKRKRPRTTKTSEEVESQRMTHIAVERNRRKQMNEHLRVLRSLMPGSYVQRGDQASIIGGAIEFVRELEQLLQCLESQKRRRLFGDAPRPVGDSSLAMQQSQAAPLIFPTEDQIKLVEFDTELREETAESKSCLADVEVRLLGFDAMIKILCRRRPGQLIKIIAALEDLQLNILHTNITTIEQTVLYSFNVKVTSETSFTAEDTANSVQQILSFIHANGSI